MENSQIKEIALANGFSLKEQLGGHMDLNPYVYEFAQAIKKEALEQARSVYGQSAVTDADTDSIDSDIDKARDGFIEEHLLDNSESEELEMLISKACVLGELYERKKWQEGNGLAIHEALNTGEAQIGHKLEEFKKLWIAGGGHFAHFTYLPKEGEWSISSVGLPESVYPLLLNALVTLNTAWVFYLGAWSKCEALARKEKNGLSADLRFSKLRESDLKQKFDDIQSWIAVESQRANEFVMDAIVVPANNLAEFIEDLRTGNADKGVRVDESKEN